MGLPNRDRSQCCRGCESGFDVDAVGIVALSRFEKGSLEVSSPSMFQVGRQVALTGRVRGIGIADVPWEYVEGLQQPGNGVGRDRLLGLTKLGPWAALYLC